MNPTHTDPHAPAADRWELPEDVFLVGGDPHARLVDLRRGRFYALDPVGRRMIELARTAGGRAVAATLAAEFGVTVEAAEADWHEFRSVLESGRLLCRVAGEPRPCRTRRPADVARCSPPGRWAVWFLLLRCWLSLRLFGWARTVRRLRARHPAAGGVAPESRAAAVRQIDDAVRREAAGMLLNPECKERAVAAWHLLRSRFGIPARLVVGTRPYPFEAHAWVECDGRHVTDDEHRCTLFTPVAVYE